jgi:hypothetical protein
MSIISPCCPEISESKPTKYFSLPIFFFEYCVLGFLKF